MEKTIFEQYFGEKPPLIDRYRHAREIAVDVIIPVFNTNELWQVNLLAIYREIPVARLLVGDGGCTDQTLKVLEAFPRTVILEQGRHQSLGFCLRELISAVETEWFVYLHSDVFLPEGWFDEMRKHQSAFDWFECSRRITINFEYLSEGQNDDPRPYSGSQMGRKAAFEKFIDRIDDDFLYRNEDLILAWLVKQAGGRYGRISDTFHYHQVMNKRGEKEPKLAAIQIKRASDTGWEIRTFNMQLRGLIKYTSPRKKHLVESARLAFGALTELDAINCSELRTWTADINVEWSEHLESWIARNKSQHRKLAIVNFVRKYYRLLFDRKSR